MEWNSLSNRPGINVHSQDHIKLYIMCDPIAPTQDTHMWNGAWHFTGSCIYRESWDPTIKSVDMGYKMLLMDFSITKPHCKACHSPRDSFPVSP